MIDGTRGCHGGRCVEEIDLVVPICNVTVDELDAYEFISMHEYTSFRMLDLPRQFGCEPFSLLGVHVADTDVHSDHDFVSIRPKERDRLVLTQPREEPEHTLFQDHRLRQ